MFVYKFKHLYILCKIKKTVEESIANQSLEAKFLFYCIHRYGCLSAILNNPQENDYYWKVRNYLNDARIKLGALFVYTLKVDNPEVSIAMITGMPKEMKEGFGIGVVCTVLQSMLKGPIMVKPMLQR